MKTKKGSTYTTLLAVIVHEGTLSTDFRVPMALGNVTDGDIATMIDHMSNRIATDKKPGATYEKCLERIDLHREQLVSAYVELFETYQRAIDTTPKTRASVADTAQRKLLVSMGDKMLRVYATSILGEDTTAEYILPDDKESLITALIATMKDGKEA